MPMPTTSPAETVAGFQDSRVSSVMIGSPYFSGVAAARTYSHRGVITPTPNDKALGLMRWTFIQSPVSYHCARVEKVRPILSRSDDITKGDRQGDRDALRWLAYNRLVIDRPPRPPRAETREIVELRQLKEAQPELGAAVEMQI